MKPEVAKCCFGVLALAVADSIADASAEHSPNGPAAEAMLCLRYEPGLSISDLATRIRLSHAGTVRLLDRLEKRLLVERRREKSDKRTRFIHLTEFGEQASDALLETRNKLVSQCLSLLSPEDLSVLGELSERILLASDIGKARSAWLLAQLCQNEASVDPSTATVPKT